MLRGLTIRLGLPTGYCNGCGCWLGETAGIHRPLLLDNLEQADPLKPPIVTGLKVVNVHLCGNCEEMARQANLYKVFKEIFEIPGILRMGPGMEFQR
jgi:hypothetical protein